MTLAGCKYKGQQHFYKTMNLGIAIYVILCVLMIIWLLRLWFEVRFSQRTTDPDYYLDGSDREPDSRQITTMTEVTTISKVFVRQELLYYIEFLY